MHISSKTGKGIKILLEKIHKKIYLEPEKRDSVFVSRERHRQILIYVRESLIQSLKVEQIDIKAEEIITHSRSNIVGNIKSKIASLGGKLKGNVNSDQITIKKTADIEGVLNQKTLSIHEGAQLKIKAETYK